MTMCNTRRALAWLVMGVALGILGAVALVDDTPRVVMQWRQEPINLYTNGEPYTLYLSEKPVPWFSRLASGGQRSFEIRVVRGGLKPEVHFAFAYRRDTSLDLPADYDVSDYAGRIELEWRPTGVTIIEPSGTNLIIPAAEFAQTP